MPRYCIVIPSYCSESTIVDAITSAVNQNYKDYSIVVSDNCSQDNTIQLLSEISSKKIKVIANTTYVNKSDNWNRAYSQSDDCEYFINLHSDDILNPNVLNNIDNLRSSKSVLIHGSNTSIDFLNTTKKTNKSWPLQYSLKEDNQKELLLLGNSVGIVGTAINKKSFDLLGGWSAKYNFYQDVELWYELSNDGDCIYSPRNFGFYRGPKTYSPEKYIIETLKWYQDKIKAGLNYKLKKAAINSILQFIEKILEKKYDLPNHVLNEMNVIKLKYINSTKYLVGISAYRNLIKLKGLKIKKL
jgi:glycosyltransferase involved in cell wall biosynthesis